MYRFKTVKNLYLIVGVAVLLAVGAGMLTLLNRARVQIRLGWTQYATTTFSVSYPPGYMLDESYSNGIAPGRVSSGIKLTIPRKLTAGTDLSPDSYISIEWLPTLVACSAAPYLYDPIALPPVAEDAHTYSVARADSSADGGPLKEIVYTRSNEGRCIAVRYVLRSVDPGTLALGAVSPFKSGPILEEFDGIRRSLVIR